MCLAQGPQRSDAGKARTRDPSVSSQALYHWATALPDISVVYWLKAAYSVTFDIFRKIYFLFKSFVKVELIYVFTINLFTIAENCTEKWIIL